MPANPGLMMKTLGKISSKPVIVIMITWRGKSSILKGTLLGVVPDEGEILLLQDGQSTRRQFLTFLGGIQQIRAQEDDEILYENPWVQPQPGLHWWQTSVSLETLYAISILSFGDKKTFEMAAKESERLKRV